MSVETLQNSACFSEMSNLGGHMPRFTSKNEGFPIYLMTKVPFLTATCEKQCEIAILDHYMSVEI